IGDGEGDVEDLGKRLRQECLAAPGRTDEQNVALLQFDVVIALETGVDPLVVVVDSDREDLLRPVLADDVLVELLVELARGRDPGYGRLRPRRLWLLLLDDLPAELNALVADIDLIGAGDQA